MHEHQWTPPSWRHRLAIWLTRASCCSDVAEHLMDNNIFNHISEQEKSTWSEKIAIKIVFCREIWSRWEFYLFFLLSKNKMVVTYEHKQYLRLGFCAVVSYVVLFFRFSKLYVWATTMTVTYTIFYPGAANRSAALQTLIYFWQGLTILWVRFRSSDGILNTMLMLQIAQECALIVRCSLQIMLVT